ncbi:trypco2 family protein [Streptomyces violascens]|uniref:Trypsin-co-occurring domain-containing protein n=1 Tax=Streptomyces violascens TaxID=67381 RepID=A0ABQ3QL63_9ACTN|nr:trypco2 family protein [Streptomyces violascens]GGU44536.1 hypothetical protein GCM10010289_76400 [Streptomyces violascens]GHI38011.1 hypothetical protein Sviol_24190 [Streptomyces violascens]
MTQTSPVDSKDTFGLDEVLQALSADLKAAHYFGIKHGTFGLGVAEAEVSLSVTVTKDKRGDLKISVITFGGELNRGQSEGTVHHINLRLVPLPDGGSLGAAAVADVAEAVAAGSERGAMREAQWGTVVAREKERFRAQAAAPAKKTAPAKKAAKKVTAKKATPAKKTITKKTVAKKSAAKKATSSQRRVRP